MVAAAPEVRIVAFYITSTGELVADSLALSVTDYFANKVSYHRKSFHICSKTLIYTMVYFLIKYLKIIK